MVLMRVIVLGAGAVGLTTAIRLLEAGCDVRVVTAAPIEATLVGDLSVYPVRGQIVRVKNPGLVMSVRDEFHPAGRAYVHPRSSDCILGGTLDEHQWDIAPDPATAEAIISRCMEIVPALADADVIDTIAGLRPGRPRSGWKKARPRPGPPASSTTTGTAARASRSAGAAPKTLPSSWAKVLPRGYDHRHAGAQARAQAGTASGPG